MRTEGFHPHRLAPRYSALFAYASRVPWGLEAACKGVGWLAFDGIRTTSETPETSTLPDLGFVVCGFPRTGTTYAQALLGSHLATGQRSWHTHDVLAIDSYHRAGLPVVVTLRDPIDTVASWSTYHGDTPSPTSITRRLRAYEAWHRRLTQWVPHVSLVGMHFESFTQFKSPDVASRVNEEDKNRRLDPLQQHLPHRDRDVLLNAHRDMATHLDARRALVRAQAVYSHAKAHIPDNSVSTALAVPAAST